MAAYAIPSSLSDLVEVRQIQNSNKELDDSFQGSVEIRYRNEHWFTVIGRQGKGFPASEGWDIRVEMDAANCKIEKISDVFPTRIDACLECWKLIEGWENDKSFEKEISYGIGF